jgi:hypothetical protein
LTLNQDEYRSTKKKHLAIQTITWIFKKPQPKTTVVRIHTRDFQRNIPLGITHQAKKDNNILHSIDSYFINNSTSVS